MRPDHVSGNMTAPDLWLIGAGPMARAYAAVLDDLEVGYMVVGRGKRSAAAFTSATGRAVRVGGVESALREVGPPSLAIVAVSVDQLSDTAGALLDTGVSRILLEKPGGLGSAELTEIRERAGSAEVSIAYNRRHYASTGEARRLIARDGGVTSFAFELTEWPNATEPVQVSPVVRRRWFLAQTSHVVDLAFHLGGRPVDWSCHSSGALDWHAGAARFSGSGLTDSGATFGYHGDWEAPGRWSVEILTRSHRFVFHPLEELRVVALGTHEQAVVELDDRLDRSFKPGVYCETRAFLDGGDPLACSLDEQIENMAVYETMAGY